MATSAQQLQTQYPLFVYREYEYHIVDDAFECRFTFALGENTFNPVIRYHGVTKAMIDRFDKKALDALVFHLGLVEIPSYWKLTCAPTIEIACGSLTPVQQDFWKKLIEKGMGEFFFVNDVVPFAPHIQCKTDEKTEKANLGESKDDRILVPIGGGKDSAVTLELLSGAGKSIHIFTLGQDEASEALIAVAEKSHGGYKRMQVDRVLDPHMLALNNEGFLNGHTPFSSMVAFTSFVGATLLGIGRIALSNERSANEETGVYNGVNINHQYSKSYEFEHDFRSYVAEEFRGGPSYFSLLRPLYELQIMSIFSRFQSYFPVFRSCNVGKKNNVWCGHCAKCLFVSLLLSTFLPKEEVVGIIGKDMLDDPSMVPVLDQLTGQAEMKAFECVGTRRETMAALYRVYQKTLDAHLPLPALIQAYEQTLKNDSAKFQDAYQHIEESFDDHHYVPEDLIGVLKHALEV